MWIISHVIDAFCWYIMKLALKRSVVVCRLGEFEFYYQVLQCMCFEPRKYFWLIGAGIVWTIWHNSFSTILKS